MQRRAFFSVLAVVVLALLTIGAGGFYWLVSHSPLGVLRQRPDPAALIFVPKQAPIVASLLVNPDQLITLRRVMASPSQRRQAQAELNQLKQSLLASANLNYERDIQPWLGNEITVAVTTPDIDRDRSNGLQPGYLLAVTTQNPEQSREFLQLFWQRRAIAGEDLMFEQYQGVKLIYANPIAEGSSKSKLTGQTMPDGADPGHSLATAAVGNQFLLFANHPRVLREAINTVQAEELALANTTAYQTALENLTRSRLGLVYINLPELLAWTGRDSQGADPTGQLYQSIAIAPGIAAQGLRAETVLLAAAGQNLTASAPELTQPVQALQFVPKTSAVAAAGSDLEHLWQQVNENLPGYGIVSDRIHQQLATLKQQQHLDLPLDIFAWVKGEFALGMLLQPQETEPDWVFVAQRSAETDAAIAHLDELAKQQGYSAGPLTLGNQQVSAWTRLITTGRTRQQKADRELEAQIQGLHATLDGYEVFASSVEAMTAALQAPKQSLLSVPAFNQAVSQLPQPNNGYLFIDWISSRALLERQLPILRLAQLIGSPIFSHLQSLTLSSTEVEPQFQRAEIFLDVK